VIVKESVGVFCSNVFDADDVVWSKGTKQRPRRAYILLISDYCVRKSRF